MTLLDWFGIVGILIIIANFCVMTLDAVLYLFLPHRHHHPVEDNEIAGRDTTR